ncbi:MAG: glutamine amidotransferase, partial [Acidobacteriota bacterium]
QTGYSGRAVTLVVEDEGRIAASQAVTLPPDGESSTVPIRFTAADAGPRTFRFRIAPLDGEQVVQNNVRDALIEVWDRKEKVLYFEGEPRFETKFLRRAVEDDKNLQVSILLRTAENKYWRGDVATADELAGGFPKTREELFAYRAVILGSVEAAAFAPEQLRMLADFVGVRGGSLLMLGGRRAFAEGGWGGTPVADVLPVVLDNERTASTFSPLSARPTRAGLAFPVTQIADTEEASAEKWGTLAQVSTVNAVHAIKPGATELLNAMDRRGQNQVVLAYQRYGRGKAVALPIQDSWTWKMDAKVPVTDTMHAMFWRRMVRWLVDGVPDQLNVATAHDRVEPGEPVPFTAEALDTAYVAVNDARVEARVVAPSGKTMDVPLDWTVEHDGEYGGVFNPDEPGLYELQVTASRGQKELGRSTLHIRVSAGDAEYYDAGMRAPLLRRIAEETGGRFFTPANVASLPDAISYSGRGVTVVEERALWDMPALLLLVLGLVGAEWGYRRARGLA